MRNTKSSESTGKTAFNPKFALFMLYSLYDAPNFM